MLQLTTVDAHVAGGGVRLITSGLPHLEGALLADRQSALVDLAGHALSSVSREPRGHGGIVTAVLAEADRPEADAGLLFFQARGASPFCGHALIGAVARAIERGLVTPRDPGRLEIDTLAGPVVAHLLAPGEPGRPARVSYSGPPAVVMRGNVPIQVGRRSLRADLVFCAGELVAIIDAEAAGVPLVMSRVLELQRAGVEVVSYLDEAVRITSPVTGERTGIAAAVFIGPAPDGGVDVRSGCVFADGGVERSPGGTATAAVAAVLTAMGLLKPGRRLVHQGLLGTSMEATVGGISERDGRQEVHVDVEADAWPTGDHTFVIDPADPLADGALWL
jgi:proline racemase